MKRIAICLMVFCVVICSQAQESFTQFHFSGLEVTVRQAEQFSYKLAHPNRCRIRTEQGWLVIEAKGQKDRKPKSKLELWVTDIENLCVQNGKLLIEEPLEVEFLEIEAEAAEAQVKVNAHFLQINLGAESHMTVEGTAGLVSLNAKSASTLNAGQLIAEKGEADVQEKAEVTAYIREVTRLYTHQGEFRNSCE